MVYQDAGAFVAGPQPLIPAAGTGNPADPAGHLVLYPGLFAAARRPPGWSGRCAAARADRSIDWIIVQMHQDATSSSATGNGSDLGIRQAWLPLFDRYQVDLVLCGHDHDYERSFPVRGFDRIAGRDAVTGAPVQTPAAAPGHHRPDSSVFDTSQGTVHLILGGGGTSAPLDEYGIDPADGLRQAKVFTRPEPARRRPRRRACSRGPAPTRWRTPPGRPCATPATGYGIAVFDVHPGEVRGGMTSITVRYFHAVGADPVNPDTGQPGAPTPDYTEFETLHPGPPPLRRLAGPATGRPRAAARALIA